MTGNIATDTGVALRPDLGRVVTRLFVAGREDVGPGDSRAAPVIQRVLDLSDAQTAAEMADVEHRFSDRHRHLNATFREHADLVIGQIDGGAAHISGPRHLLLGAAFTHEYAIEAAALCNPSVVPFGEPSSPGAAPFVMSVRGIGEGHRSSIGFRTGEVTADGTVRLDAAGPFPVVSTKQPALHHRSVFHAKLEERDNDYENASFVLDALPDMFDDEQLVTRIVALTGDAIIRRNTPETIENLMRVADASYRVDFPDDTKVSERVLWPHSAAERHGMEDARFVRFVADDGAATYYATYTAFDGANIAQHILQTDDFRSFLVSPLAGAAAQGKGLALFPRTVGGRFVALSRSDRESNAIAFSDDMRCWPSSEVIQKPARSWELLQLGNCGSPIETDAGWLVLTHGVGPMRTYSIGVVLLDLDEPQTVIATSVEPIIIPDATDRDGYVPNVVYSCGGFAHGDVLVLPYGIADQRIAIATLSVSELVASLQPT